MKVTRYHLLCTHNTNGKIFYLDPVGRGWINMPMKAGRFRKVEAEWLKGIKEEILKGKNVTVTIEKVPNGGYQYSHRYFKNRVS